MFVLNNMTIISLLLIKDVVCVWKAGSERVALTVLSHRQLTTTEDWITSPVVLASYTLSFVYFCYDT